MVSPLHLIFLRLLPPLLLVPVSSTSICPTHCGKVSIPYPFGVGPECSLEASFNIICNTSTRPHKPYLNIDNTTTEVVEIKSFYIRVKHPKLLLATCNNTSPDDVGTIDINLSQTQYILSNENWVTAIGCDDLVAVQAYKSVSDDELGLRDACISVCASGDYATGRGLCPNNADGNSVGEGCCRTPVPKGSSFLVAGLNDMSKTLNRSRLFPCSYAFVMENGVINQRLHSYNLSVLQTNYTTSLTNDRTPVVRLDWRIGAQNCSTAQRNSSYACQQNSSCVDYDPHMGGYLCNCSKGYHGNPYVGCQDIDECESSQCGPHSKCVNTDGSFDCVCERGYTGDGRLTGHGCTKLQTSKTIKILLIGLASAMALVLLLSTCFWLHRLLEKRKSRRRKEHLFKHILLQQQSTQGTFGKTKLFTTKELEKATDHFNESRICGQGGQGIVYKGMLSDGTIVAIKKLKHVDEDQLEQFINEIVILSQINHKNVVKLLGCCLAVEVPLVVYEFLPNGTLSDLIRHPNIDFPLTWKMRLKIAADVAGAVAYLHSASSLPIYHRDIKSTNILLDEKYVVKVSDFGTSKFVQVDQTHLTTLVKGTFGYLDPEYYRTSHYTEKSDVYSFGVVLVELLTGQRPISMERPESQRNLATHFVASMETGNVDGILDAQVLVQGAKEEVIAVASLAERCLSGVGKMRPTMKQVALELETLMISQKSLVVNDHGPQDQVVFEAKPTMFSNSEYTCTISDDSLATSSSAACP